VKNGFRGYETVYHGYIVVAMVIVAKRAVLWDLLNNPVQKAKGGDTAEIASKCVILVLSMIL